MIQKFCTCDKLVAAAIAIIALAPSLASAEENPSETETKKAEVEAPKNPVPKGDDKTETGCQNNSIACSLFVGVGVGLTHNLSGPRTSEFKVAEIANEGLFVQVTDAQDAEVRILFETHYLLQDQSAFSGGFPDRLSALAACGPFALVSKDDVNRRGCGPFFAAAVEPNGTIAELGFGWFIGFGKDKDATQNGEAKRDRGFGVGFGFMVNPDATTIDGRIVDLNTMYVRDEFEQAVKDGNVQVTTKESTIAAVLMISKDF